MGGKCRPGAWLVQGSPRPCAPLNVQCPSSPATSTPHPSCIAVCDGSVIDPRQTINCNANNANADELQARLRTALDRAKAALAIAKEKQAEYANRSRADAPEYQRGDWVLLSTEHLRREAPGVRKWDRLWTQPLMVLDRVGAVSYRLALPAGVRMHDTFHASLLRPFKRSERFSERELPPAGYLPTLTEADRQLCNLHSFVDFRRIDGVPQYQVHWVGEWGDKTLTWEPARRLQADLGKALFDQLVQAYQDGAPPALPLVVPGSPAGTVHRQHAQHLLHLQCRG